MEWMYHPATGWVVAGLFFLAFFLTIYYRILHRLFYQSDEADEIHFVRTSDGARIALFRYRSKGESSGEPILFCHGLASSRHNFDLDHHYSWSRHFAAKGYDSWVVEWRGVGMSESPQKHWNFDDHLEDAEGVIDKILEVTGAEKLHWVGHSMGGMIMYAYLGSRSTDKVRSGVALGSPCAFGDRRGYRISLRLAWLLHFLPRVYLRVAVIALIPFTFFLYIMPPFLQRMVPNGILPLNVANINISDLRTLAYNLVYSPSASIFQQFALWVRKDAFCSFDEKVDYQEGMKSIDIPIFLVYGSVDLVAQRSNVLKAEELIPTENFTKMEMGRDQGCREDYGHGDLVFGTRVKEEVIPQVEKWIVQHQPEKSKL